MQRAISYNNPTMDCRGNSTYPYRLVPANAETYAGLRMQKRRIAEPGPEGANTLQINPQLIVFSRQFIVVCMISCLIWKSVRTPSYSSLGRPGSGSKWRTKVTTYPVMYRIGLTRHDMLASMSAALGFEIVGLGCPDSFELIRGWGHRSPTSPPHLAPEL